MNRSVNGSKPDEKDSDLIDLSPNPMSVIGEISRLMNNRLMEGETKNSLLQKSSRFIMLALAKADAVTQLDLVNETHLKAPTVSITLQKLEKDGYIERRQDDYDLRSMRVFLTSKGKSFNEYIIKRVRNEEKHILEVLTSSESKQLMQLLQKLKSSMISDVSHSF